MDIATKDDLVKFYEYTNAQDHRKLQEMSKLTFDVLDVICDYIQPGVKESDVIKYCYQVYQDFQIDRIWHKPYIRFGKNTITTFRDIPKEDATLGEEDIAYVDIGIVKDGIEGDAGRTIHFGNNPIHAEIVHLTKSLYEQGLAYWKEMNVTGVELYRFVEKKAQEAGYIFNLIPGGHLIGSFPHASAKYKNGMSHFPDAIQPFIWIFEIQIRHPTLEVGGFYEKIFG